MIPSPLSHRPPPFSNFAAIPTLFPAPIANVITALATSARLSLRVVAFFVEAMLETSQYSTRVSLGYTRRLLITAISSARRVYLMSNAAFDGDFLGVMGIGDHKSYPSTDSFLQVLDKYTNLGIYVIHHTFTMAELFAMSGFYLTANAVQSAHFAAQESVALFDSVFGSNESSRALSSIITLVRRELLEDDRFKAMEKGKITSLTALTKALTAFACLQTATWRRTSERLNMKILYDCTVVSEYDDSFASQTKITTQNNLAPQDRQLPAIEGQVGEPSRAAGPGPRTAAARARQQSRRSLEEMDGTFDQNPCSTSSSRSSAAAQSRRTSMDLDDLWDLEDLVVESADEKCDLDEAVQPQRRAKRTRDDIVEITDELTESTVTTQMLEHVHEDGRRWASPWHLRQRSAPLPDVTVEDADDEEPQVRVRTAVNSPRSSMSPFSVGEEEDWIEVDQVLDEDVRAGETTGVLSAPNGSTSIGTMSYRDALEHPSANAERIQLVLKTMTNKLLQRKRTIRMVRTENVADQIKSDGNVTPSAIAIRDVERIEWDRDTANQSAANSKDASGRSPGPSIAGMTLRSGESTPKKTTPLYNSRQSVSPPSTFRRRAQELPIGRAFSRARSAFRSKSRSSSPFGSPDSLPADSTLPTSFRYEESPSSGSPLYNETVDDTPTPNLRRSFKSALPGRLSSSPKAHRVQEGAHRRPSISAARESVRTSQSRVQAASAQNVSDSPAALFPHDPLIKNIYRFMRYSSAAYGQNFLRILGLGNSEYNFPSTVRHHANSWAFAQHTNISIDDLLLSSYAESTPAFTQKKAPPLVHYIAVEHKLQAVILTCRGTLGLSDVLIDLTCEYRTISVDGGRPDGDYYVHAGMYQSALGLTAKNSTVHQTLIDALTKYPAYGLVVCGHSLGGGVAALLAIACGIPAETFIQQNSARAGSIAHPPILTPFVTNFSSGLPAGRPIHCYSYGPPAIASPDLARHTQGLITSVVQNSDVVPCLSLGVLRDLKNVAVTLFEEGNIAEEIVGRVVGIYQRKFSFQQASNSDTTGSGVSHDEPEPTDEEALHDWMISLIKTMRADMDNDKLYPPGM
ncbi:MAG: hypothetical protein TREMPRED_005079, partial [Tremellales sp. Tagirdzhanova-0007]